MRETIQGSIIHSTLLLPFERTFENTLRKPPGSLASGVAWGRLE